jgi:hypothetical protein
VNVLLAAMSEARLLAVEAVQLIARRQDHDRCLFITDNVGGRLGVGVSSFQ